MSTHKMNATALHLAGLLYEVNRLDKIERRLVPDLVKLARTYGNDILYYALKKNAEQRNIDIDLPY